MELYTFHKSSGKRVSKFDSDFIMTRMIQTDEPTNIGCMHLEENGVIGYHEAKTSQLLVIVSGEGYVRGNVDSYVYVESGDAVFWEKGEWHETRSDQGLTAIVIEGMSLDPASFMAKKIQKDD